MVSVGSYIYSSDQDDMCFDWSMEEELFIQARLLCYYFSSDCRHDLQKVIHMP